MPAAPAAPTPRRTLAWVAWVRLLAILGVVSIHNSGANAVAAQKGDHAAANLLGVLVDIPLVVVVPIFVMVSGTLTLNPRSFTTAGAYLRRRVLRTLPAIVVWHLAYIAFLQLYWYPEPLPARVILDRVLTGRLVPHLYFLWIVLGLSLVAPVLMRWLRDAPWREQLGVGVGLALVPVVSTATRTIRTPAAVTVDTAWTWWIPYLGLFVLGYVLKDVVLRGVGLLLASVVGVGLPLVLAYQFLHPDRLTWLQVLAPVSYYGGTVVLASVCLFMVARSTIREGGLLGVLARPGVVRVVNPIAVASLGIYACHLMILWVLLRTGWFGGDVLTAPQLVGRFLATVALAVAVTLVGRRIPVVRQVF